jgi:hypothetical protein
MNSADTRTMPESPLKKGEQSMCILCQMGNKQDHSTPAANAAGGVQSFTFTQDQIDHWQNIDQTPANPFGKDTNYETFLDYLGALQRPLTPTQAQGPIVVNVSDLNDHPDYKAAAIAALHQWSSVTPLQFIIVDDRPYNPATDYLRVVSPELGEANDGSAFSSGRFVSVGQRFHDTEPNKTDPGGYIYNTFIHEFGHEFGLNHPGFYNYGGPGGPQITYYNDAKWVFDTERPPAEAGGFRVRAGSPWFRLKAGYSRAILRSLSERWASVWLSI